MEKLTQDQKERFELFYFQVSDIWKRFCEEHSLLLDLTLKEYALLLESNLDSLENAIDEKKEIIARIDVLEQARKELIQNINSHVPDDRKAHSVKDLINLMAIYRPSNGVNHLQKFNDLLIDIIKKIQDQNKKNQLFINKAVLSLKEIREETLGKKSYTTYTAKASTTPSTNGAQQR